jgi:hypothetical protein
MKIVSMETYECNEFIFLKNFSSEIFLKLCFTLIGAPVALTSLIRTVITLILGLQMAVNTVQWLGSTLVA